MRAWVHGALVALVIATAVAVIAQQPVVFPSPQAVTGPLTDTQLRASAVPVSGTFFQATQPVSAASLPLPTGAATESTLGTLLTQSDFDTKTGSLTEAAPASDTASSGLNGRLQRIAQRLTSMIALLPAALGANGGLKIEGVASGTVVPVSGTVTANQGGTWTVQPGNTANTTAWKVDGSAVTQPVSQATAANLNARTDNSGATGAAPPARADYIGGLASGATGGFLTGVAVCDLSKGVNITTATTTLLVTGVSGRQVRVCSFHLVTAAANNVQWLSGTGATCGTGTSGIGGGGTTAASGYNFAANGGIAVGSGLGQLFTTTATGDSLCAITSAATQLAGILSYTIY